MNIKRVSALTNQQLLKSLQMTVTQERQSTADVIVHLSEIDRRKLYLKEGFSSLFSYLTENFHYAGGAAYRRTQAARYVQKYPVILGLPEKGEINLTTLCLIAPHLTSENKDTLLKKIVGKSKREVEYLVASLFNAKPEPLRDKIRLLPIRHEKTIPSSTSSGGCSENKQVLRPEPKKIVAQKTIIRQVKVEFVADERVAKKIERAKEILRHKFPKGSLEEIFNQALEDMLEKRDPERKIVRMENRKKSPVQSEGKSRYIPQPIRRLVWQRDKGRCSYRSPDGKICAERSFIEVDHIKPWALGGESLEQNLRLLCAQHNRFRAQKTFGKSSFN